MQPLKDQQAPLELLEQQAQLAIPDPQVLQAQLVPTLLLQVQRVQLVTQAQPDQQAQLEIKALRDQQAPLVLMVL